MGRNAQFFYSFLVLVVFVQLKLFPTEFGLISESQLPRVQKKTTKVKNTIAHSVEINVHVCFVFCEFVKAVIRGLLNNTFFFRIAVTSKTKVLLVSQDSLEAPPLRSLSSLAAKPPGLTQGTGSHSSALSLTIVP